MKLEFHHVGNAVNQIDDVRDFFEMAGYTISDVVVEERQRVRVAYARKEGSPLIELLEPLDERSHLNNVIKRSGCGPYHICYAVDDIKNAMSDLQQQGFMALSQPVPGHGLDDALTVFLYNKKQGLIQLVQD